MTIKTIQIEIRKHLNIIANSTEKINQLNNMLKDEEKQGKKLLLDEFNVNSTMCVLTDNNNLKHLIGQNTCEDILTIKKEDGTEKQYSLNF